MAMGDNILETKWSLQEKIKQLESQLEKAEKVIKFYGEKESWTIPDIDPITGWGGMSSKSSIEHDKGKRAREHFKNKKERE